MDHKDRQGDADKGVLKPTVGSGRLRRMMETPPGFWLTRGIPIVFLILAGLFLLAWLVPLPGYGGRSFVQILVSPV